MCVARQELCAPILCLVMGSFWYVHHMQDCDASSSFQWQQDSSAGGWEELYGWPPDPMWTESNWPPDQPSLQLFQVVHLVTTVILSLYVNCDLCAQNQPLRIHGVQVQVMHTNCRVGGAHLGL